MGKQWKQCQTLFWGGSKITVDGDCSHDIKRGLLLGRNVITNLDSIIKSRDITLPTKVRLVKAYGFSSNHVWIWELDCKESSDKLMLLNCGVGEDSWEALRQQRNQNQSILKEVSPEYSLEGLMLKLQYFGHQMQRAGSLEKDCNSGKDWEQEEKGAAEDEMVEWHHRLNGHEFEQTLGDSEGQGSLVYCSPWGCKELDMT